ncbi:MAG TPA: hypothetical protein VJ826_15330 [Candidatus Polarisedimenticolaceae bacterium]|nr:hypothetical protein [Candidatus Polarisedimenticolaceae bacterium]
MYGLARTIAIGTVLAMTCCASAYPDPRVTILEEQTKALLMSEAADAMREQFGVAIDPAKARLVVGSDVEAWFDTNNRVYRTLPEPYRSSINHSQQVALVVEDALPTKAGGRQAVLYLRSSRPGVSRWLVLAQPDPCGDGNPATCERCTGCSGESSTGGTLRTCVCTLSCDDCVPCRPC